MFLNILSLYELYKDVDITLIKYNKDELLIKYIHCNSDFKTLMDELRDKLNVKIKYTSIGEHVPKNERNNYTIVELIHA